MKITTAQRKKIKKETLAVLNKKFTETENDSGEKIPEDFKKIFNSFLTDIIPSDTSELISLKEDLTELSQILQMLLEGEGEKLDDECKTFIIRVLNELFSVTNNQGIGNNLWKYFPNLWDKVQFVNKSFIPNKNKKPTRILVYKTLNAYENFYELTTHHLIEFLFVIAQNSIESDDYSKEFVENYLEKSRKGQTLMKGELLNYCRKKKFLKQGQCSFFKDSWIRNNIAHANFRYDEKAQVITLGKKEITLIDLKDALMRIYLFNIFLLSQYFTKALFFDSFRDLLEKTPLPK